MKQLITIFYITFLLGIANIQAQNYIPMAVDSAVWLIGINYDGPTGAYAHYLMEFTNGDTMVNNVHYYKVYSQSTDFPFDTLRLKMLIRDNPFTHTVHAIVMPYYLNLTCQPLIGVDVPLFDFSPFISNQGGVATNCYGANSVMSIDTMTIYGMNRRVFQMIEGQWIEGVGGSNTGLEPGNNATSTDLVQYCRGTPGDCGAHEWVKTKDIRTYQNGKLYPNPAQHQARLELEEYINHGRVLIYNLLGQLQSEQYFEGQEAVLDVRNYEKGIYMVQVFDKEKLIFGEKLVVN